MYLDSPYYTPASCLPHSARLTSPHSAPPTSRLAQSQYLLLHCDSLCSSFPLPVWSPPVLTVPLRPPPCCVVPSLRALPGCALRMLVRCGHCLLYLALLLASPPQLRILRTLLSRFAAGGGLVQRMQLPVRSSAFCALSQIMSPSSFPCCNACTRCVATLSPRLIRLPPSTACPLLPPSTL